MGSTLFGSNAMEHKMLSKEWVRMVEEGPSLRKLYWKVLLPFGGERVEEA